MDCTGEAKISFFGYRVCLKCFVVRKCWVEVCMVIFYIVTKIKLFIIKKTKHYDSSLPPELQPPSNLLILKRYSPGSTCSICFLFTFCIWFFHSTSFIWTLTMFLSLVFRCFSSVRTALNSENRLFLELILEFGTKKSQDSPAVKKKKIK